MFRFLGDIERLCGRELETCGKLIGLYACFQAAVTRAAFGIVCIELVYEIDTAAVALIGDKLCFRVQVGDWILTLRENCGALAVGGEDGAGAVL